MTKPIRVLHILQRMEAGGSQALLMNIYRNIDRSKVQFDFLVHYKEKQFYDDEIEKMGGKIYRLSVREDYNFFRYYRELNNFFKNHNEYKVVHGHMHSLGAIYLYCAKVNGIPVRIAHAHNNSTSNDIKKPIKEIMTKYYKKSANILFACSRVAGKYMFGDSEFRIINNAIDTDKFISDNEIRNKIRTELGIKDKFVIGHVGRFELQKNHKFLIDIFNEYRKKNNDAVLVLVGKGSLEKSIKEKVLSLGIQDYVYFLGNRSNMAEIYQAFDVFLFPSLYEGLGIVAVEAQTAGIPVICTKDLPEEINLSSLYNTVSLDDDISIWIEKINEAAMNSDAHSNMSKIIKSSGFEIKYLAKEFEEFYLSKYEKQHSI